MNIKTICDSIKNLFNTIRPAAPLFPAIIMACSLAKRPGLSVILSASNIIRKQAEFGAPTEQAPDGQPNMMNALIVEIVDEVYRALREDANIQVSLAPGSVLSLGTGASPSGPVTVQCSSINFGTGHAALR